jgi:perosamine synthetase
MSRATYERLLNERPAIAGGTPVRDRPIPRTVIVDREARREVSELLRSGALSVWKGGPSSRRFETEFAAVHGSPGAVAVNSGTSALHCAYVAAGLEPGDEVVVSAACYVSAASAAVQAGARVAICDIDPDMLSMDPQRLGGCITERTRLIVPVHLWGIPSAMHAIRRIAAERHVAVVEDCAQAIGASIDGQLVGTFGALSAFSFSPEKMISTGQGGMVLCGTPEAEERARRLVSKGKGPGWHDYLELGYSYVMSEFEAITGMSGLRQLRQGIESAGRAVEIYCEALSGTGLRVILPGKHETASYYKCAVRLPPGMRAQRDDLLRAMAAENVGVRSTHPPLSAIAWLADFVIEPQRNAGDPCPVASRELPLVIEIETGPNLGEREAWRSAAGIRRALEHVTSMM